MQLSNGFNCGPSLVERRFYRVLYRWSRIGSGRCCSAEQVGERRRYVSMKSCFFAGKQFDGYQEHGYTTSRSRTTPSNGCTLPSARSTRTMSSLQELCMIKRTLGLKQISLSYLDGLGSSRMSTWTRNRAYSTSRIPESRPKRRKPTEGAIGGSGKNETPSNVESAIESTEKEALTISTMKDISSPSTDSPTEYPMSNTLPVESPIKSQTVKESYQENYVSGAGSAGIRESSDLGTELSVGAQLPDQGEKKKRWPEDLTDSLRQLMRAIPHSVVVLTTHIRKVLAKPIDKGEVLWDTKDHRGMTLSSFTTVTLTPDPIISFNIKEPSQTLDSLRKQPHFLIHILKQTSQGVGVAEIFAKGNGDEKTVGHAFSTPAGKSSAWNYGHMWRVPGQPRLPHLTSPGVLRILHCEVLSEEDAAEAGCGSGFIKVGHHTLVLAKVHDIWKSLDMERIVCSKEPTLCYQHGSFVVTNHKKPILENLTPAQMPTASKDQGNTPTVTPQRSEQVSKKKNGGKEKPPSDLAIKANPQKLDAVAAKKKKGAKVKTSSSPIEDKINHQKSEEGTKKKKGGREQKPSSNSETIAPLKIRKVGPRIDQPLELRTARMLEEKERNIKNIKLERKRKGNVTSKSIDLNDHGPSSEQLPSPTPIPVENKETALKKCAKEDSDPPRDDDNKLPTQPERLHPYKPIEPEDRAADTDLLRNDKNKLKTQAESFHPPAPGSVDDLAAKFLEKWAKKARAAKTGTDELNEQQSQSEQQLHAYQPPELEKMDLPEERVAEDRNRRLEPDLEHKPSYPPPRPHGRRVRRPADDLEQW